MQSFNSFCRYAQELDLFFGFFLRITPKKKENQIKLKYGKSNYIYDRIISAWAEVVGTPEYNSFPHMLGSEWTNW